MQIFWREILKKVAENFEAEQRFANCRHGRLMVDKLQFRHFLPLPLLRRLHQKDCSYSHPPVIVFKIRFYHLRRNLPVPCRAVVGVKDGVPPWTAFGMRPVAQTCRGNMAIVGHSLRYHFQNSDILSVAVLFLDRKVGGHHFFVVLV